MNPTMHLRREWQHPAYGYREAAFATLVFGIYLHASRLVFGGELVESYLLRPPVDEALGLMMAYSAVAGVTGWRSLRFRSIITAGSPGSYSGSSQ